MGKDILFTKEEKIPAKMKLIIALTVILALSNYAHTAAAACVAASWCQSCASGASACTACYSFAQGTNKNKIWSTNAATTCTGTNGLAITDCLYYTSSMTGSATTLNASTTVLPTTGLYCSACNGKNFLTYTTASVGNTCTDTAPTMTSGTCATISGCVQTVCITNATTNSVYCAMCENGQYPLTANSNGQVLTCTGTKPSAAIANCYYNANTSGTAVITYGCGGCDTGYAMNNAGTACVAHTASEGCQSLQPDNTNCAECWPAYYFSGALCVAKSFVGYLVGLAAFITLLILQ